MNEFKKVIQSLTSKSIHSPTHTHTHTPTHMIYPQTFCLVVLGLPLLVDDEEEESSHNILILFHDMPECIVPATNERTKE